MSRGYDSGSSIDYNSEDQWNSESEDYSQQDEECGNNGKEVIIYRRTYTPTAIEMVKNVFEYVKGSWAEPKCKSYREVIRKTGDMVKIPPALVARIVESNGEKKMTPHPIMKIFDTKTLSTLRRLVHNFYLDKKAPTIQNVLEKINSTPELPHFGSDSLYLMEIMYILGFYEMRKKPTNILMDKHKIALARINFWRKMLTVIENCKKVYYQGIINLKANKSLYYMDIGSDDGFVPKARKFSDDMSIEIFEKWFEEILPLLQTGSIVVMNAKQQNMHLRGMPSCPVKQQYDWPKKDIQNFLKEREVPFDEEENTYELQDKAMKYKKRAEYFKIDEMAAKYEIEILRLPPYHAELNALMCIFDEITDYLGSNLDIDCDKTKAMSVINKCLESYIDKEKWSKSVQTAKEQVPVMEKLDNLIDDVVDSLDNYSSDDVSDESDSSYDWSIDEMLAC